MLVVNDGQGMMCSLCRKHTCNMGDPISYQKNPGENTEDYIRASNYTSTCTDFRGKVLKEYTKVLKFGLQNEPWLEHNRDPVAKKCGQWPRNVEP